MLLEMIMNMVTWTNDFSGIPFLNVQIISVTEMLVNILNICSDEELLSDSEEAGETEGEITGYAFMFSGSQ